MLRQELRNNVFRNYSEAEFTKHAVSLFQYQYQHNAVYRLFTDSLKVNPALVSSIEQIPFLPVELFKSSKIVSGEFFSEVRFTSSGTTGEQTSVHHVKEIELYEEDFLAGFRHFYGEPEEFVFLALLPSYLEREGSSLIYMMEKLIEWSDDSRSGFFLHNHRDLYELLLSLKAENKKVLLLGVTYALLDFAEAFQINFPELIAMETGGMKGKRKEMIREEVHQLLCPAFGVKTIHSEYGMTELLSQGYSSGNGIFQTPPWMKIVIRDMYDPMRVLEKGQSGGVNIIDFGNIDSCAFLATQDLGKIHGDGSFEINGRIDFSDIRGCNLMVE
ncbi:MAG: acyl transferase [Bacteroidetes bacterium]|nr:acyl transferase [Bacteroidota bacterium]